jgi:hypothetical protein
MYIILIVELTAKSTEDSRNDFFALKSLHEEEIDFFLLVGSTRQLKVNRLVLPTTKYSVLNPHGSSPRP